MQNANEKDPVLWEIARKRASFKGHLASYIIVNLLLWGIWYFDGRHSYYNHIPWPVWPMLGWGIGLAFHYVGAYVYPRGNAAEKEYDKLIQKKDKTK